MEDQPSLEQIILLQEIDDMNAMYEAYQREIKTRKRLLRSQRRSQALTHAKTRELKGDAPPLE